MKDIPQEALEAIVERLRGGASALIMESQALGFTHNGPLRAALKKMLGAEGYDELMGARRHAPTAVVMDDSAVPVITATPVKDGWRIDTHVVRHYREEIFVSPDGTRYVRAQGNERADLIVDLSRKGLGRVRLRKQETSAAARAVHRHEKQVAQGQAAHTRRKAARRAK